MSSDASATASRPHSDRRARRRLETIEEILDIAEEVMTAEGVNGLSLSEVARRLGVQPPSLYKYFPSLMAVYDALFLRGQREHLATMRHAMADAEPGLAALAAGLDASGRWSLENRAIAQLPAGCRAAFVLHDVEGLEHGEVAEVLGIAEGTSKSQVHKARMRLRALLAGR